MREMSSDLTSAYPWQLWAFVYRAQLEVRDATKASQTDKHIIIIII